MRRSFYKKCCWVVIVADVVLWLILLKVAPDEWIGLTALFAVIVIVAVSHLRTVMKAGDQIGSFAAELPAQKEKSSEKAPFAPKS